MPQLLSCPTEILLMILTDVDAVEDLKALSLTCRLICSASRPLTFKGIIVHPESKAHNEDVEGSLIPFLLSNPAIQKRVTQLVLARSKELPTKTASGGGAWLKLLTRSVLPAVTCVCLKSTADVFPSDWERLLECLEDLENASPITSFATFCSNYNRLSLYTFTSLPQLFKVWDWKRQLATMLPYNGPGLREEDESTVDKLFKDMESYEEITYGEIRMTNIAVNMKGIGVTSAYKSTHNPNLKLHQRAVVLYMKWIKVQPE
ncbi:hypothetical protein FA15DRAFT_673635 [Coprinopsis marcescibilis]|uniref:F-box domain-containing protein n=1 Tax=Coprinopsis marcescibilis TaxID=230819 RepID=A0A5C3KJE7_COPMA|nr:hypothetical protein FA15DRAFT_673635 [Coprinopsis marcescibilis]